MDPSRVSHLPLPNFSISAPTAVSYRSHNLRLPSPPRERWEVLDDREGERKRCQKAEPTEHQLRLVAVPDRRQGNGTWSKTTCGKRRGPVGASNNALTGRWPATSPTTRFTTARALGLRGCAIVSAPLFADLRVQPWPLSEPRRGLDVGTGPNGIKVAHIPSGIEARVGIGQSQFASRDIAIKTIEAAITHPRFGEDLP
jgi:hypothetical protein